MPFMTKETAWFYTISWHNIYIYKEKVLICAYALITLCNRDEYDGTHDTFKFGHKRKLKRWIRFCLKV